MTSPLTLRSFSPIHRPKLNGLRFIRFHYCHTFSSSSSVIHLKVIFESILAIRCVDLLGFLTIFALLTLHTLLRFNHITDSDEF